MLSTIKTALTFLAIAIAIAIAAAVLTGIGLAFGPQVAAVVAVILAIVVFIGLAEYLCPGITFAMFISSLLSGN